MTRECISFTFDPRDMLLSLQMEPSSETTAPRYLKLVTVPNFCPFTCIFLWMPFALFVISLVFSALISILYLVQVLSRLSTRASSSCSSSARASMSSASRRLVIFLPPMLTFPSCSSRASDMIRSRKMLKRVDDRRHPCLTPTVVLNHSPMLPICRSAENLFILSKTFHSKSISASESSNLRESGLVLNYPRQVWEMSYWRKRDSQQIDIILLTTLQPWELWRQHSTGLQPAPGRRSATIPPWGSWDCSSITEKGEVCRSW